MKNRVPLRGNTNIEFKMLIQKNMTNKTKSKTCAVCHIEKHFKNFYRKYSECEEPNMKRGVNFYYDSKVKISIQQKV